MPANRELLLLKDTHTWALHEQASASTHTSANVKVHVQQTPPPPRHCLARVTAVKHTQLVLMQDNANSGSCFSNTMPRLCKANPQTQPIVGQSTTMCGTPTKQNGPLQSCWTIKLPWLGANVKPITRDSSAADTGPAGNVRSGCNVLLFHCYLLASAAAASPHSAGTYAPPPALLPNFIRGVEHLPQILAADQKLSARASKPK